MKSTHIHITILSLLGTLFAWGTMQAQTDSENYVRKIVPKTAMGITELENELAGNPNLPISLTLDQAVGSGDYTASKEVILKPGFHAASGSNVHVFIASGVNEDLLESITYLNGHGKSLQSMARGQSPDGKDMVSFAEYDEFGRMPKSYLPYTADQNSGQLVTDPKTGQQAKYQSLYGDSYAFTETRFDGSPLNRVQESSSPGYDWRLLPTSDNDHTVKFEYQTNNISSGLNINGKVYLFEVDDTGASPVITPRLYGLNQLLVNTTKNENWQPSDGKVNTVDALTDKNGRPVATIVYERDTQGAIVERITQNVYDIHGRLRYILPPRALQNVTVDTEFTIEEDLVYQYEYDQYNRKVAQRVPGSGWEYMVYDPLDRPILVKDANLANNNQWLFTKYDAFGRTVYSGIFTSSKNRVDLQAEVDTYIDNNTDNPANIEKRIPTSVNFGGTSVNYSDNAFPVSNIQILSVNYYDDYDFTDYDKPATPTTVEGQTVTTRTQGLPTASFTKTLGQTNWSKTYSYYDERGREVRLYKKNHLGGYTTTDTQLDFRGKVQEAITKHKYISTSNELVITDRFTYDYAERPLGHYQTINNQTEERIAENVYNELGQLVKKKVGGLATSALALQEYDYDFNVRGQLAALNDITSVGADLFAYRLGYNEGAKPMFNGNITTMEWRTINDGLTPGNAKKYNYEYDELHRLTKAYYDHKQSNSLENGKFSSFLSYDENGNLKTLDRVGDDRYYYIDRLTYSYFDNSNQLKSVQDQATSATPELGFKDGTNSGNDYVYNLNGNLTSDLNKGITNINYNHLDKVTIIEGLEGGHRLWFTYDASGRKLRKTMANNNSEPILTTDYLGGFQYVEGDLQFFPTPEGYVQATPNGFQYVYIHTDHLGNNRVSYADANGNGSIESDEVLTKRDYYPFGLVHSGADVGTTYNYTFQGKEWQNEEGLNWFDFGSRMYDPALGRWMATDPQNQFASPYLAFGNDPVSFVDPDGEFAMIAVAIGAAAGAIYGGIQANKNGGSVHDYVGGILGGAIIGAASSAIGSGTGSLLGTGFASLPAYSSAYGTIAGGSIGGFSSSAFTAAITGDNIWQEGLEGALTGAIGAGIGGYIGGTTGAFSGGFSSSVTNHLLDGNNIETSLKNGLLGGAISAVSYNIQMETEYRKHRDSEENPYEIKLTRKQWRIMSRETQKSFFRRRERGAFITKDGGIRLLSWGSRERTPGANTAMEGEIFWHTHPDYGSSHMLVNGERVKFGYTPNQSYNDMSLTSPAGIEAGNSPINLVTGRTKISSFYSSGMWNYGNTETKPIDFNILRYIYYIH